jgi:CheY-like chemotaxis protein/anti-sigma regulatory factor (Ser/Thr protein kinase)
MTRILIVDDDRVTRHLFRRVLTDAGYATHLARDGAEALRKLRAQRFDLVLLDVWMPRMTGLQLLERLRSRKRGPRVIVMTSDDAPETLLAVVRQQAFRYLHKPVQPASLLETVQSVLSAAEPLPIEVISARPDWVELLVPCTHEAVERIATVMAQLEADLPAGRRESIADAFRELLQNAIEWGGRLRADRKVRIAYLRTKRMLMYRIADPGEGFDIDELTHAAVNYAGSPIAHMDVREKKGLRPGGFGLRTARGLVDELIYNEKRNEVVFVQYLDSSGS